MYNPAKPYTEKIKSLIEQTWRTKYCQIEQGRVTQWFRDINLNIAHVDGIGTKGVYHWKQRSFTNAVRDAVRNNLNDMAMLRATPVLLTDHIFLPRDDEHALEAILLTLVDECKARDISIAAGETAIHDTVEELEISIAVLGFSDSENRHRNVAKNGDLLIGLQSSGLHSNGFSLFRKVFKDEMRPEFIIPTENYYDILHPFRNDDRVHAMMNITGGAFSRLKTLLTNTDAVIRRDHLLQPTRIFFELNERGVPEEEMYSFFNCGIGFVLAVENRCIKELFEDLHPFQAAVVGEITEGTGKVLIESAFSKMTITL